MNRIVEVPSVYEIDDSPQIAVLAVLEHATLVARTALLNEHSAIGQLGFAYEGRLPPRQILLAQLIVDRCSELVDLIGWYRRSCPHMLGKAPDTDDGLPF
jgi:hypothetical protein